MPPESALGYPPVEFLWQAACTRVGAMRALRVFMALVVVPGMCDGPLVAQPDAPRRSWHTGLGLAAGALLAPGEIGRGPNATGSHEALIARLGNAFALGAQLGFESRYAGAELRVILGTRRVEVESEFGTAFPSHGEAPLLWSGNLLLYPLGLLQGSGSRLPRPFLGVGLGGAILSADLDNVKGQTLFHSFLWSLGGGLRLAIAGGDSGFDQRTFLELRLVRHRVWGNGSLHPFIATSATIGLGIGY